MGRVAILSIVKRLAPAEGCIRAASRIPVERGHSLFKRFGIDAAALREFSNGVRAHEIAALDEMADGHGGRAAIAEAVAALKTMVANHPALRCFALRRGCEHSCDVIVITIRLVAEASAILEHANDAWLGAIDDVW